MENKTTKKEYYNSEYGFKYSKYDDGSISVVRDELNKMLSKQPIMVGGKYPSPDDESYMEHIEIDFETLIDNVGFTKQDMFGRTYQVSFEEVSQVLLKVYIENGWSMAGEDDIQYKEID